MSSIAFCLLLSCSRWFLPSVLCRLAIFCLVVLLISSLSLVATLCSVCSTYCPSFLLCVRPISHFCFSVYSIMPITFVIFLISQDNRLSSDIWLCVKALAVSRGARDCLYNSKRKHDSVDDLWERGVR